VRLRTTLRQVLRPLTSSRAALGIPLATLDTVPLLDVAIDGSDEARLDASRGTGYARADRLAPP